jgi:hypothetical protein
MTYANRCPDQVTGLDDKPLVVVTANEQRRKTDGWARARDRLAMLSNDSDHRFVEATREGVVDEKGHLSSIEAIEDAVRSIRTGRSVSGS